MESKEIQPGMFGLKHTNRDFSKEDTWGKNIFNSFFPASLVAYMSSKSVNPVYITLNKNLKVVHKYISGTQLFGIDPLSDELYYSFESSYAPFDGFFVGTRERENIDLVLLSLKDGHKTPLHGLEIKLTALPDSSTRNNSEDNMSCEIVVRPPTICYIACGILEHYKTSSKLQTLRQLIEGVPNIDHWEDASSVGPHYQKIREAIIRVMKDMVRYQTPIMVQPVWKTEPKKASLTDDCLDVFVWSNIALMKTCADIELKLRKRKNGDTYYKIERTHRTIIWLYRMLFEYVTFNSVFDYQRITSLTYGTDTDKAFSRQGTSTIDFLRSPELTHPRINKSEIKNIILGGGQNFLSPERRFDAILVNTPGLFED